MRGAIQRRLSMREGLARLRHTGLVWLTVGVALLCSTTPDAMRQCAAQQSAAQESTAQANLEEDDENPFRPGLVLVAADGAGRQTTRLADRPFVDGDPRRLDERLGDGPYTWRWRGRLWVQQPGEHRLAVYVCGRVTVRIGEQVVLDAASAQPAWHASPPLALDFDHHRLEIQFTTQSLASAQAARLGLYWSSAAFSLEPIPARFLLHDRESQGDEAEVARTQQLGRDRFREARCAACHESASEAPAARAPALDRVRGNLQREWIVEWLQAKRPPESDEVAHAARTMPYFQLSRTEALDLAAYLIDRSPAPLAPRKALPAPPPEKPAAKPASSQAATNKPSNPATPNAQAGLRLLRTVGCLACHTHDGLGTNDSWAGGDLTQLHRKRPADFVERWLADPSAINVDHRMPAIDLNRAEARDLAAALSLPADRRPPAAAAKTDSTNAATPDAEEGDAERGRSLFRELNCQACHRGPEAQPVADAVSRRPLQATQVNSPKSCLQGVSSDSASRRPRYAFTRPEQQALAAYAAALDARPQTAAAPSSTKTRFVDALRERRCLSCHARDGSTGISVAAAAVVQRDAELAPHLPALVPPSLTGVGDKLHDAALDAAIRRAPGSRRPWLAVRMPRFEMSDEELRELRDLLVASDRVPAGAASDLHPSHVLPRTALPLDDLALRTAGGRLVTPDGFGCTSCHAVGGVQPPPAPLNARGPDLAELGQRIRPEWFDRWVRNPARLVPRMEMPSVQLPVRGVLDDRLDQQLAAAWHVLNLSDFVPPEPNPVQTLRLSGVPEAQERAELITDVVQADGRTLIKPLLIGLPNRHNVLWDLEAPRLVRWSLGDLARQRTKGKSWHWEAAGVNLLPFAPAARTPSDAALRTSDIVWQTADARLEPRLLGQFPCDLEGWRHVEGGLEIRYRLEFAAAPASETTNDSPEKRWSAQVVQTITPLDRNSLAPENGFRRRIRIKLERPDQRMRLTTTPEQGGGRLVLRTDGATWDDDRSVLFPPPRAGDDQVELELEYRTTQRNDQFLSNAATVPTTTKSRPAPRETPPLEELPGAPGFIAQRLPLDPRPMPTALAWRPDGTLIVASLKGRVLLARDQDGDSLEDAWSVFSDELAAPYGVAAAGEAIDVATKYAVLRLYDDDRDGRADRTAVAAAGWGHTADYHDWTVGLPSDGAGGYFIGLACQQDKRPLEAARLRGTVVHLVAPHGALRPGERFRLEVVSGGHRFPMGFAKSTDGQLFVTDNQGNYNPFNELNHVRAGKRYGFINALEQRSDFQPPTESPAIEIPHPWTRSVNGLALLDLPAGARSAAERPFGPFTGHLVGCEYDTRRLVRMSLQKTGETYQGAVYPLTLDDPQGDQGLLGPLCCAVSPEGALYVGGIRDSGWGGGNNHGEIVRMTFAADRLPPGIAEMRATDDGFEIDWTRPLDPQRLAQVAHYGLSSYRRVSTPAYGGNDQERRDERIERVDVELGGLRTRLRLSELRRGFVYELRVRNLTSAGERLHPAEAYFTLRGP